MELKDKLVASFMAFENKVAIDVDSKVHDRRSNAIEHFEKLGFPSKKEEAWKYTNLKPLLNGDFNLFDHGETSIEFNEVKKYFIHDIDSYKVIFVNGVYSSYLSETTHDIADVCIMSSALTSAKYKVVVETYFDKLSAGKTSLSSLNTAFAQEGAYIHIPKNTILPKPIQIINFSTGSDKDIMCQPRNLVVVGENSQVQIIERHQSLTDNQVLTNSVTEIFVDTNAIVDFYKVQNDNLNASLIDSTFVSQKKNSVCSVHTFSFGGKMTRNNLEFYHEDERLTSNLKGITILENKQHVDHHTLVEHSKPNCDSNQVYKGIFHDQSTGVFNGKVFVTREAQKTNAYQQSNNILVDDKATINAKPQLEIFADDVSCSHGCTIGQLDEDSMFYLQSRGIPRKEAKALLMYAFSDDVLESVKIPQLKSRINKLIASKLGVNIGFDL